ncbi:hypothetical protein Tco_0461822 [Tanacetum coccineum]
MPPRRLKKKSIKRLVEKRVAKAIEEYEKSRANLDSAGSSGGNPGNAGGTMNVHGCSHKTFMNGKPHTFNGTEGVVGLRRWIEKIEGKLQVLNQRKYHFFQSPATLLDAINMAVKWLSTQVQGRLLKLGEAIKGMGKDHQRKHHHHPPTTTDNNIRNRNLLTGT